MIGAQILNYRIVEKLGDGGMGSVYKAVDVMLEREVALKFLRPELAEQPDLVERFRSEAVVLARLTHHNVASLFGLHRHGNDFFMAMEFVPGKTVEALLKQNGRLSVEHASQVASHVLHALDYAHRHGVVHRDIKAANIIVTPGGNVKVMDFGIARVLGTERRTRVGFVVGTIGYMAPEQIQGLDVDGRTDIYAVGVVLYEMLTGRMPFQGDTEYAVMQAQVQQMPVPPREFADIPVAVETCIMRALAKQPGERYQTAAEFNGMLQSSLRLGANVPVGSGTFARPADETREFKSDPALQVPLPASRPSTPAGSFSPASSPGVPAPAPGSGASLPIPPPHTPPPAPSYTPPPYVPPAYTPPPFTTYTPAPSGPRHQVPSPSSPAVPVAGPPAPPPVSTPPPLASPTPPPPAPPVPTPAAQPAPRPAAAPPKPGATASRGLPPALAALLGVLALVVVAVGAFFAWQQWRTPAEAPQALTDPAAVPADAAGTEVPTVPPAGTPVSAAPSADGGASVTTAPSASPAGEASPAATGPGTRPAPAPGTPRTRRTAEPPVTTGTPSVPAAPAPAAVDPVPVPVAPEPQPLRPVLPPAMFGNVKWMRVEGSRIREVDVFMQVTDAEIRLLDRRNRSQLAVASYPQLTTATYSQGKRPRWRTDLGPAPASTAFDDTVRTFHYVAFQGPSQFLLTRVNRDDLARLRDEVQQRSSLTIELER